MTQGEQIFENIQRLSHAKGMTINEVCTKSKVSRGTIGDLGHGRRNGIGNITVDKLTKVLECSREDILGTPITKEPMPEKPVVEKTRIFIEGVSRELEGNKDLRRLVRAAMKATPAQVRSTAVLLESIVDMHMDNGFDVRDDGQD